MRHTEELFVCVMPWVGLEREIKIGNATFSPWKEVRATVSDSAVRNTIQWYADCFVDLHGKPVRTLAICSYKGREFQCLTDDESCEMRRARDALVFAAICPQTVLSIQGCSIGLCSTERFQVVGQQLKLGGATLYVISGHNTTFGRFTIHKPLAVGGYLAPPKSTLVTAFDKVFASGFPGTVRTRLCQSLEWFRLAHVEGDQVSEFSKTVMMATAFETLLGISAQARDKSMSFAKEVEKRFRTRESVLGSHPERKEVLTKAAWWAYDFYKLRNRIVHGDNVGQADISYNNHVSQKNVADAVLCQIVFQILCENGCIDYPPIVSYVAPEERGDCLLCFEGFEETQRALGWIEEKASDACIDLSPGAAREHGKETA